MGASLTFLRFFLEAPDGYFRKNGKLGCDAQMLENEKFSIEYCSSIGYEPKDLLDAGFNPIFVELKSKNDGKSIPERPNFEEEVINLPINRSSSMWSKFNEKKRYNAFNR